MLRIIPADAGSTRKLIQITAQVQDHPRGCGEHLTRRNRGKLQCGSSPRMRGAQVQGRIALVAAGIIPADAGSTWNVHCAKAALRDHPRGCGEHRPISCNACRSYGSSPRMRGARGLLRGRRTMRGIIPADAGSTRSWYSLSLASRDHPRGCGEHCLSNRHVGLSLGSSPRMRGAHGGQGLDLLVDRIIPADAGSTYCPKYNGSSHWDHPRGCGEHACCAHLARDVGGSSPRMRGAPASWRTTPPKWGIIPADAGSTLDKPRVVIRDEDHPRGCGEHL